MLSSQGTVNSPIMITLLSLDQMIRSDLISVTMISGGNYSLVFRSSRISQSLALARMPRGGLGLGWLGLTPSLMNGMGARFEHLDVGEELKFLMTTSSTFPISSST